MPNYDYRCERTGEMFETWQAFSDEPLGVCGQVHAGESKACGSAVRKVFSSVGISFKGDGFYTNDHGARSRASDASSESTPEKPAGEKATDKPSDPKSSAQGDSSGSGASSTDATTKSDSSTSPAKDSTAA